MDGPSPQVRILDRIILPAPFGIVFWDFATGSPVADGLSVTLASKVRPESNCTLTANRSGVWIAPVLPGISPGRLAGGDWDALKRTYRLAVDDRYGRFLPFSFEADLPSKGLYEWPGWSGLELEPLSPLGLDDSPPGASRKRIPLFSAPARPVPSGLAEVRCQLKDLATGAAASSALVTAAHEGVTCGIGLSDSAGNVCVLFPYPERPLPTIATSPPAIPDFHWTLDIAAFWQAGEDATAGAPDLGAIFAQLSQPRTILASVSPIGALAEQSLAAGAPLILRSGDTERASSSFLFLGPD